MGEEVGALLENISTELRNKILKKYYPYIGGTPQQTRKKLWSMKPKLKKATDSIANAYDINPELLRSRLDAEGFTDAIIKGQNMVHTNTNRYYNQKDRVNLLIGVPEDSILHNRLYTIPAMNGYGTDDSGTLIKEGKVKLINERWQDGWGVNEKGREVYPAEGITNLDNIGITAATLKYFRNEAKKRNPKFDKKHLDEVTGIYYNMGLSGGQNYLNNR